MLVLLLWSIKSENERRVKVEAVLFVVVVVVCFLEPLIEFLSCKRDVAQVMRLRLPRK